MRSARMAGVRRSARGAVLVTALLACLPAFAQAPVSDPKDINARLDRLERLFNSNSLLDLVSRLDRLSHDLRDLRGQIEVQNHEIAQIKQHQRELYLDLDQRLSKLEASAPAPAPATTTAAGTAATGTQGGAGTQGTAAGTTGTAGQAPASTATGGAAPTSTTAQAATAPAQSGAASVDPLQEQRDFQAAFNLLRVGKYDQATVALRKFLTKYPNGRYSGNAQYWLGETFYVRNQLDASLKEFETLVKQYPDSQKLAGALLKIGYIQDDQGKKAEAERTLRDLIKRFPASTAAGLARKRLQHIRAGQ